MGNPWLCQGGTAACRCPTPGSASGVHVAECSGEPLGTTPCLSYKAEPGLSPTQYSSTGKMMWSCDWSPRMEKQPANRFHPLMSPSPPHPLGFTLSEGRYVEKPERSEVQL